MLAMVFVFALVAGGIGWLTRQRTPQPARAGRGHDPGAGSLPGYGSDRYGDRWTGSLPGRPEVRSRTELADREAETSYWVDRLGAGLTALDGRGSDDEAVRNALGDAAERRARRSASTPGRRSNSTRCRSSAAPGG